MPIRNHRKLSLWKHANPQQYGGLVEVSLRYTPVTGRLHTRYAPVRRSSAEYCYSLLPLDLHVLSLPLAFILSQDQTLHCKNCSFTFFDSSSCPRHISYGGWHTLSLLLIRFKSLLLFNNFFNISVFRRKRMQRYNHFPNWQNIFSKIFPPIIESTENQYKQAENIFSFTAEGASGNHPMRTFFPKNSKGWGQKERKLGKNYNIYMIFNTLIHIKHTERSLLGADRLPPPQWDLGGRWVGVASSLFESRHSCGTRHREKLLFYAESKGLGMNNTKE